MGKGSSISDETARTIDSEIKLLIERNYKRAEEMLRDNMDILHSMKDALMKYETIDARQIDDLMARREVRQPADWDKDERSNTNPPADGDKLDVGREDEPKADGEGETNPS